MANIENKDSFKIELDEQNDSEKSVGNRFYKCKVCGPIPKADRLYDKKYKIYWCKPCGIVLDHRKPLHTLVVSEKIRSELPHYFKDLKEKGNYRGYPSYAVKKTATRYWRILRKNKDVNTLEKTFPLSIRRRRYIRYTPKLQSKPYVKQSDFYNEEGVNKELKSPRLFTYNIEMVYKKVEDKTKSILHNDYVWNPKATRVGEKELADDCSVDDLIDEEFIEAKGKGKERSKKLKRVGKRVVKKEKPANLKKTRTKRNVSKKKVDENKETLD